MLLTNLKTNRPPPSVNQRQHFAYRSGVEGANWCGATPPIVNLVITVLGEADIPAVANEDEGWELIKSVRPPLSRDDRDQVRIDAMTIL